MSHRRPAHAAFTLVELLVVISIIGLLLALLLPAVQKIRDLGPRTKAVSEISQLSESVQAFKSDFKVIPPTQFTIPAVKNSADPNFLLLAQMFPRWMSSSPDGTATGLTGGGITLTSGQSLYYFLAGPGGTGWAVDAPIAPSAAAVAKKGPYFDFPTSRVQGSPAQFIDPWGMPYAYIASGPTGNYLPAAANTMYPNPVAGFTAFTTGGKPVNPGTCQIISAGKDKSFGPGGAWAPGTGAYTSSAAGFDDLANFNGGVQLGVIGN